MQPIELRVPPSHWVRGGGGGEGSRVELSSTEQMDTSPLLEVSNELLCQVHRDSEVERNIYGIASPHKIMRSTPLPAAATLFISFNLLII